MAPAAGPVALWNAVSRARFAYRSQILKPRLINAKNNTLVGRGQFDAVGRHVVVIGRIGTCFVAHGGAVEQWGGTPSYYPAAHGAFVSKSQAPSPNECVRRHTSVTEGDEFFSRSHTIPTSGYNELTLYLPTGAPIPESETR